MAPGQFGLVGINSQPGVIDVDLQVLSAVR